MKINKLIIKSESFNPVQVQVMKKIKSLKKQIKECAKRLAYLEAAINEIQDEEYSYQLRDSWYDCYYDWEQSKKSLKALRDKYHFFFK